MMVNCDDPTTASAKMMEGDGEPKGLAVSGCCPPLQAAGERTAADNVSGYGLAN